MYVANKQELVVLLREKLSDYLVDQLKIDPRQPFRCFMHSDNSPSMRLNPKTGNTIAHCFGCGASADIFNAAAALESLPDRGPEWITHTIPLLAQRFNIPIIKGEVSEKEKERIDLQRLIQDIANTLAVKPADQAYLEQRGWTTDDLTIGSIDETELMSILVERGWDSTYIASTGVVRGRTNSYFGLDKITFVFKDARGQATGFISRNINPELPKYINSSNNIIFDKSKSLMGIDTAVKKGKAKTTGIYIVEGPGDLANLYRKGILNAVAICGTAFTNDHLLTIKALGITKIFLCLDWDIAGIMGTSKILKDELKNISGISVHVVEQPNVNGVAPKDIGELMNLAPDYNIQSLQKLTAFEWLLKSISKNQDPETICINLLPSIVAEPTAIKRDMLIKTLSDYTKVSYEAIKSDVESRRNGALSEKLDRLKSISKKYAKEIDQDPANTRTIIARMEEDISSVEKEYEGNLVGTAYQLSRYDALQTKRFEVKDGAVGTEFNFKRFSLFGQAFSGGMDYTSGVVIYVGGRANSGKTAVCTALAMDVLLSDEDTIVLAHFTDDNYVQVEPRLKSAIAEQIREFDENKLKIGVFANPLVNSRSNQDILSLYHRADGVLREAIANEKLIVIDAEDGSTLSTLEKHLKYVRSKYPDKKLLVVMDNTHNYRDYPGLEATARMKNISTGQKELSVKYRCCIIATVEYRKNGQPTNSKEIRYPVDDDIADSRSMMYHPNAIIHVYNDLHDRSENPEIFWVNKNEIEPRLVLVVSKNKISEFKDKLFFDLTKASVTLEQRTREEALQDWKQQKFSDDLEDDEEQKPQKSNKKKYYADHVESDYDE